METDTLIREAIKQTMSERGLTQQALAGQLGIKQQSLQKVLSGDRGKVPQSLLDVLDALSLELTVQPLSTVSKAAG